MHRIFPLVDKKRVRPWPTLEIKPRTHPCRTCILTVQLRTAHLQDLVVVHVEWQAKKAARDHPGGLLIIQRSRSDLEILRKLSLRFLDLNPATPVAIALRQDTHGAVLRGVGEARLGRAI